jgi:hypothetical protein
MTIAPAELAAATASFKALGLTQAQAQEMVNMRAAQVQAGQAAETAAFAEQLSAWENELKSDKDFGGANFDKTRQTADIAIAKFGSPALNELLKDGLGKHPEIVRTFARIGALLKEDSPGQLTGGTAADAGDVFQRAAANLYKK